MNAKNLTSKLSLFAAGLLAWAGIGGALAQTTNNQAVNLPLSSVGSEVGWDQRAGAMDDYRLAVFERAANQPLRIELFSPDINLNDYRNKRNVQNYYGDEIYSPNARVSSRFALLERGGNSALVQRDFGFSESHTYESFYQASMAQGFYQLPVQTRGNGKNAFGFRLTPGIAVEASQFTVVTRGQANRDQLAARLTIGQAAVGKTFRIDNFDADGPQEMQIFVRFPNGTRRQLTSSGDVQWAGNDIRVTPEMLGEWAILVRIIPTTKQFSNSVKFRLKLGNQPYFARMPAEAGPALPRVQAPPPPAPKTDLTLTKTVSTPRVTVGDAVRYTLTVVNTGPDAAENVTLTDRLPAGLGNAQSEGSSASGNTLTWNLGTLAVGERRILSLTATAQTAGRLTNSAEVRTSTPETTLDNNRASAVLEVDPAPPPPAPPAPAPTPPTPTPPPPVIDLEVTKTADVPQVQTDQEASFTLAVSNRGDGATGVVVADTLPAGLEFVSATPEVSSRQGNTLTWNLGSLGRGQGRSITLRVRALRIGNWTNTVVVRGAEREDNTANNRAQAALRVVAPPPPPQADLGVIKSAGVPRVETGRSAVFTLTVSNAGPDAATGVVLSDTLPAGLEFVSASPAATRSGNTLTWNLGPLAKDERRTLTLEVRGQTPGRQLNTASVRGNERDPNPNNNRDQATLEVVAPPPPPPPPAPPAPVIDLAVSKSVTPGRIELGQEASFTLTVSNSGDNATGVVLTDTLPAGLEFVSASPAVTRREGDVLTWNLGSLARGESRRITVQVRGRIAGTATNIAVVRGNEKEDKTQDNTARAALEVVAPPPPPPPPPAPEPRADLGLTKTVSPAEVRVGDAVRYTLTVVNNGPDDAAEVVLRDALPQGLDEVIAEGAEREGQSLIWNLGSLASGERVSLTVRAIAGVAGTLTNTATLSAETPDPIAANNRAQATLSVLRPAAVEPTPQPQPRPQPVQPRDAVRERESEVTLAARLASAPASGVVVVSDRLPNGARYVLGSSRLLRTSPQTDLEQSVITNPTRENSDPIADPVISGDRLFWVLPAPLRPGYVVGYRLSHQGALEFPDNRLGVILQTPQTRPAGTPSDARSSGAPRVLIGEASLLKALEVARPLGVAQTDTGLVRLGGSPATLLIYPSRPLTTDRADQPELMVVVRDAQGNPSSVPYVTLSVQPEPAIADAEPIVPGYQVRVVHGEGRLPLSNLGTRLQGGSPDFVSIEAQAGDLRVQERFAIEAAQPRPLIVAGAFSLQAAINSSGFGLESTLRGFGRGSLGDTLLTGALNTGADFGIGRSFLFRDVNLLPPANPYERFPLLGDGSDLGTDTNSSDSVFLRLEQGLNYLQYGQLNTGFEGLLTGYNAGFNGLKGVVRGGGFGLNAFAAVVPDANRLEVIPGDGTTFYRLGLPVGERPVVSGSETVTRVVRDRNNPNLVLSRTLLLRGADYEADYGAGVLRLRAPLQAFDLNANPQSLEVAYAVSTPGGPQRELRGGVQASLGNDAFGIRATLLSLDSAQSGLLGLGLRAIGTDAQFEAEATTPLNRIGLTAGAARLAVNLENFGLEARYQDVPPGFQDPRGSPNAARDIGLGTTLRLGGFSLNARYSLNQNYTAGTTTQQASAEARLGSESLALLAGAGASFGLTPQSINNNLSSTLFASVGVEGKAGSLGFAIRQLIGLGNTPSATDLSLDLGLTPNFGIRAQSRLTYASSGTRLTGALGVRGSFAHHDILQTLLGNSSQAADPNARSLGSTNLSATYEMGNLDGDAGRTRLGLDTTIPLGSELQLGLSSNVVVAPAGQGGASGGIALRYTGEGLQASTSLELSAQALTPGTKSVFGLGLVWRASSDLIVSPQGTYVREANGTEGTRLGLAAAYRADRFNLLTQNVLKNGFYKDADGVVAEGEIRTGYQADERFFLRLGAAYRFADGGIFTGQVGGGFTFFLTDVLGLGLNGSYLFQPATSSSQLSFGLEASLRVANGLTFSAGTNLLGTSTSLAGFQSQPGFYLRLDWLFDESMFGVR